MIGFMTILHPGGGRVDTQISAPPDPDFVETVCFGTIEHVPEIVALDSVVCIALARKDQSNLLRNVRASGLAGKDIFGVVVVFRGDKDFINALVN